MLCSSPLVNLNSINHLTIYHFEQSIKLFFLQKTMQQKGLPQHHVRGLPLLNNLLCINQGYFETLPDTTICLFNHTMISFLSLHLLFLESLKPFSRVIISIDNRIDTYVAIIRIELQPLESISCKIKPVDSLFFFGHVHMHLLRTEDHFSCALNVM